MLTKCSNVERFVPFKRVDIVKGNLYITPKNLMRSLSTFITLLNSALSKKSNRDGYFKRLHTQIDQTIFEVK